MHGTAPKYATRDVVLLVVGIVALIIYLFVCLTRNIISGSIFFAVVDLIFYLVLLFARAKGAWLGILTTSLLLGIMILWEQGRNWYFFEGSAILTLSLPMLLPFTAYFAIYKTPKD